MNKRQLENLPIGPMPRVILALAAVIAGLELLFSAGEAGLVGGSVGGYWRSSAINDFAFSEWLFREQLSGGILAAEWYRFVSYAFLHSQFSSTAISTVFVLAFGNLLARTVPAIHVLAIFFAGVISGAVAFVVVLNAAYPLLGASPGYFAM